MPEAVAAAFDDGEFLRLFDLAVGFSVQSARIQRKSERLVKGLEVTGSLGDAAILRSRWPGRRAKTEAAAREHFLPAVVAAAVAASPRLAQVYRERRLSEFLGALVAATSLFNLEGDEAAALALLVELAPESIARLPGGEISIIATGADGSLVLDVPATATRRDNLDVDSYRASFRPAGRPGRPRGAPKPKGSGRRRIDLDKARAIRRMRQAGATLKEIALKFFPDIPPDSSSARGRISRCLEAAALDDLRS